jgi:hypothetical protein
VHERNGRQEAGLSQQPVKGKKNPCRAGAFFENQSAAGAVRELTQLGFFVLDVLANDGVKFLDHHLFRHVALVFGGGVEVTGAGGRFEFDFFAYTFSHDELLVKCLRSAA